MINILEQYGYIRNKLVGFSNGFYGFIRMTLRDTKINIAFNANFEEPPLVSTNLKDKVNEFFSLMIPLINDGKYNRFNSFDYLSKSSRIHQIGIIIDQLKSFYDLYPNERMRLLRLLNIISNNFPSLEKTVIFLTNSIKDRNHSDKLIFISIRNHIASEWIYRNIKGPDTKIKTKDLNYLHYNIEEYQNYLHNCLNFLIRDTKKFISRYPEEYKSNPDLDLEILQSLKWSVHNDFKFAAPGTNKILDTFDNFKGIDLFNLIEKEASPIKIKGWFKDKPKADYIDSNTYKAYRRTQGSKSTLEKTLNSFGLKNA